MFYCGWLQVLEHLWPSLATPVVIDQKLQGTVIVKLPGPQEAQKEGIIQPGPQIGLLLQSQAKGVFCQRKILFS